VQVLELRPPFKSDKRHIANAFFKAFCRFARFYALKQDKKAPKITTADKPQTAL
jgi:hypothetical protein